MSLRPYYVTILLKNEETSELIASPAPTALDNVLASYDKIHAALASDPSDGVTSCAKAIVDPPKIVDTKNERSLLICL